MAHPVAAPPDAGFTIRPMRPDDLEFAIDPAAQEAGIPGCTTLHEALCAAIGDDGPVCLDIPEVNTAGLALAGAHGLEEVFRTVRLYRGSQPPVALDKVFGVSSFEFG